MAVHLSNLNQGPAWTGFGNKRTMNLDDILYQNIVNSEYYTQIRTSLLDLDAIVDEIYEQVDHLGKHFEIFFLLMQTEKFVAFSHF